MMGKVKKLDQEQEEVELKTHNTPPKLCLLLTRPFTAPEAPTPPPRTAVSVPFQWEEAPGKPRPCYKRSEPARGSVARALDLPPRLSFVESNNKVSSPTTVLDGPYVGRAVSFTTSYRSSSRDTSESSYFGSSRWGLGLKRNVDRVDREDSFDFSSWSVDGTSKVKFTRVRRRRGSFLSLSHYGTSHLWANIYESFKQVIPWRRRQEEKQGAQGQNY